jgi:hypothetical protein
MQACKNHFSRRPLDADEPVLSNFSVRIAAHSSLEIALELGLGKRELGKVGARLFLIVRGLRAAA